MAVKKKFTKSTIRFPDENYKSILAIVAGQRRGGKSNHQSSISTVVNELVAEALAIRKLAAHREKFPPGTNWMWLDARGNPTLIDPRIDGPIAPIAKVRSQENS